MKVVSLSAFRTGRLYTLVNVLGTHFRQKLSRCEMYRCKCAENISSEILLRIYVFSINLPNACYMIGIVTG